MESIKTSKGKVVYASINELGGGAQEAISFKFVHHSRANDSQNCSLCVR